MTYENRQPPEGINNVEKGWARDFIVLVIGFFVGLFLLSWLLLQLVAWSAKYVPFAWEPSLSAMWELPAEADKRREYLQQLANSLAQAGGLAPEMSLTVHYSEEDTGNAFATLGGNMMIYQGLIDAVESEQGLAFVIAHEIAHIQHRHPIRAVARGLSLSIVTALVFGQTDLSQLAGVGGNLALLDYSRAQETEADIWALNALNQYYGHVAGADELFHTLQQKTAQSRLVPPEWLSTHPDLALRIEQLNNHALEMNYAVTGDLLPLAIEPVEIESKTP